MQIISAIALINSSSPTLIADIGQDLLGISALASNSLAVANTAKITIWHQMASGQKVSFLDNKLLPAFGAFPFSDLAKGYAFVTGDKIYASVAEGEALVVFNLYVGAKNQRLTNV